MTPEQIRDEAKAKADAAYDNAIKAAKENLEDLRRALAHNQRLRDEARGRIEHDEIEKVDVTFKGLKSAERLALQSISATTAGTKARENAEIALRHAQQSIEAYLIDFKRGSLWQSIQPAIAMRKKLLEDQGKVHDAELNGKIADAEAAFKRVEADAAAQRDRARQKADDDYKAATPAPKRVSQVDELDREFWKAFGEYTAATKEVEAAGGVTSASQELIKKQEEAWSRQRDLMIRLTAAKDTV
jgi:hypothetical protein